MEKDRAKLIGRYRRHGLLLSLSLLALCARAWADGGLVLLHQSDGPFVVTVFAAPNPPRVGQVDISVLAQDRADGRAALDGEALVRLHSEGGMTVVGRATRDAARNRPLYSVLMNLPEAGQWELEVTIKQGNQGKIAARALGQMSVASPRPLLRSYWRSLSLPWVIVALFALNQWLKRRAASRARQNM